MKNGPRLPKFCHLALGGPVIMVHCADEDCEFPQHYSSPQTGSPWNWVTLDGLEKLE